MSRSGRGVQSAHGDFSWRNPKAWASRLLPAEPKFAGMVANNATINFKTDLNDQLKTMVSATGSFTINRLSGTMALRDNHRKIETIAEFLGA
jgi:hypothetical protein